MFSEGPSINWITKKEFLVRFAEGWFRIPRARAVTYEGALKIAKESPKRKGRHATVYDGAVVVGVVDGN